jgi:nicotinate-nucleotide pyrophosphorylase (carboxylating)
VSYTKDLDIKGIVARALKEDIGARDITTEMLIPRNKLIKAILIAKEDCLICGLSLASLVFKLQDKNIKFKPLICEGKLVKKGRVIARIQGRAKSILTAERVALNFLSFLSGIATKTRRFVEEVKTYKVNPALSATKRRRIVRKGGVKIMDTRKTIPGLRLLEKYAVRIGGGFNHRLSLDEMILVKDNHLKIIKGYQGLFRFSRGCRVELEVKNLKEFQRALKLKPDIIMLDNMSIKDMRKAVEIRNHLPLTTYHLPLKLEASGNVTLRNIKNVASTGVDMISIGDLTHSVDSVDISLEIL